MTPRPSPVAEPHLQLLLAVAPAASGRKRWLWRTQVSRPGQVQPVIEQAMAQSPGHPRFLADEAGREALYAALGVRCESGMVAEVPKSLAPQMSAWMHVALAAELRQRGDRAGALVVEQTLVSQRRGGQGRVPRP